jgi:ubiquinone/menaquinone biosynthesis C-methylase UbiE
MQPTAIGELFDLGHEDFGVWAPLLWDPLGRAYVDVVSPAPGDHVLDVCCGAGASAIPAGRAVGPAGLVNAVDLATGLVESGRRRAEAEGLGHVRFHVADVTSWTAPEPYDLIQCGYGIFFLPDMDASARRLAGLLRPGGRMSLATWAEGALEEFGSLLHECAMAERPGEQAAPSPARQASDRINTEQTLSDWMDRLGLRQVRVERITLRITLRPDIAWPLVTGTAFRGLLLGLDEAAVTRVRGRFLEGLTSREIDTLDAATLVGVGTIPAPSEPSAPTLADME